MVKISGFVCGKLIVNCKLLYTMICTQHIVCTHGSVVYLLNIGCVSTQVGRRRRLLLGLAESDSLLESGEHRFEGGIQLHLWTTWGRLVHYYLQLNRGYSYWPRCVLHLTRSCTGQSTLSPQILFQRMHDPQVHDIT